MQPIIKHLFQADTLEDVSRERIEAFVEEYPSFGIGHYLLSRKLRGEDIDRFTGEAQRTSLYFTNPFWLQWLLENTGNNGERVAKVDTLPSPPVEQRERPVAVKEPIVVEERVAVEGPAPELVTAPVDEPIRDEEPPYVLEETEEVVTPSNQSTSVNEAPPATDIDIEVSEITPEYAMLPDQIIPLEESSATVQEEKEYVQEESREVVQEETMSAADQLMQRLREARELRESLMQINNDEPAPFTGMAPVADQALAAVEDQAPAPIEEQTTPPIEEQAPAPIAEAAPPPIEPPPPPATEESSVTASIVGPAMSMAEQQPPTEQPLVFEPYHTIDYFASQGIKLTLDENPSDALGKQLKSFTEWLKVMRKLPQKDRQIVPDIAAERTIQSIAAHSVEGKEVVTETMAEVLAKQGMTDKAREVYRKLSLLNPDKFAYFAAKIQQLKTD